MLCTKDVVKAAGLNIWANGNHNNKGPEVEYGRQCWITNTITDETSSIIAVQGLGAHPYYTWVKKPDLAQQKKPRHLSLSEVFGKRNASAHEPSNAIQTTRNRPEIMWLQDLLPNLIPNARIASYSYESDWRQDVKTNLRKCGEQFLNVLYQDRVSNVVGRVASDVILITD